MEKIIMEKPRSSTRVEIIQKDEDDDWFIYVNTVEKKSGKVKNSSLIIFKDLPTRMRYLETQGWVKQRL